MNASILFPAALTTSLCLAAAAQTPSLALSTQTPVGVFAVLGNSVKLATIAAGTPIVAAGGVSAGNADGRAYTTIQPIQEPGAVGVVVDEFGLGTASRTYGSTRAGTTASTDPANVRPGPHRLRLDLAAADAIGELVITMNGSADPNSRARAQVDVDGDGSLEFDRAVDGQTHVYRATLRVQGTRTIAISTDGHAERIAPQAATRYALGLTVRFESFGTPFTITPFGTPCGVDLVVADRLVGPDQHELSLDVGSAFPAEPIALVFGLVRVDLPLPGGCRLLAQPVVLLARQADAAGRDHLDLRLPPGAGIGVVIQAVSLRRQPFAVESSGGVELR